MNKSEQTRMIMCHHLEWYTRWCCRMSSFMKVRVLVVVQVTNIYKYYIAEEPWLKLGPWLLTISPVSRNPNSHWSQGVRVVLKPSVGPCMEHMAPVTSASNLQPRPLSQTFIGIFQGSKAPPGGLSKSSPSTCKP